MLTRQSETRYLTSSKIRWPALTVLDSFLLWLL